MVGGAGAEQGEGGGGEAERRRAGGGEHAGNAVVGEERGGVAGELGRLMTRRLVKYWSNTGQILVKRWGGVAGELGRLTSVESWSTAG